MKTLHSIPNWSENDKPREKLIQHGRGVLSDAELIAILLGSGSRNETAVELAKRILHHYNNDLNELSRASIKSLVQKFNGVGNAKAVSLIAGLELANRKKEKQTDKKILSSSDAYELFKSHLIDLPYEEFWIALLNNSNKILATHKVSMGGVGATVVDNRIILKHAIEHLASAIIICHNHPSGTVEPSESDKGVTQKLEQLVKLLDIRLLDHVIVTNGAFFSFRDEGLLSS